MFSVELKDEAVMAALARAVAAMEDLTPLMAGIGDILVDSTKARFPMGIAPDGTKWAPKSPVTLERAGSRKSNRVDSRPLFGPTGMLSSQIFSESGSDFVEIGSNRVYAAMMQFGGTRAAFPHLWGDIPARPFLGISEEDRHAIIDEVGDWLAGVFTAP